MTLAKDWKYDEDKEICLWINPKYGKNTFSNPIRRLKKDNRPDLSVTEMLGI